MPEQDTAELPRVDEDEFLAAGHRQLEVIVRRRLTVRVAGFEAARHPEMHAEPGAAGKTEGHLLRRGERLDKLRTGQRLGHRRRRDASSDSGLGVQMDGRNLTAESCVPAAAEIFDFGELGHGGNSTLSSVRPNESPCLILIKLKLPALIRAYFYTISAHEALRHGVCIIMSMGANNPSLLPMLRLWTIVLFCLFTYIHATATLGTESAEKAVRALNPVDRHDLLSLMPGPTGVLIEVRSEKLSHAKKAAAQAQAQQAAA